MCDFEQWVDIFQINLPEPEDLNLLWMKGRQLYVCTRGPEVQKVIAARNPQALDISVSHGITVFALVVLVSRV